MARTFDLYNGIEALYYFQPSYYEDTNYKLTDKSGNENHATAQAGTVIDNNGYKSFGRANLNGSDNYFATPIGLPSEFSVFFRFKMNSAQNDGQISGDGYGNGFRALELAAGGDLRFEYTTGNESRKLKGPSLPFNEWQTVSTVCDGNNVFLYRNTELVDSAPYATQSSYRFTIGANTRYGRRFDGEISVVGVWNRAISPYEITYMNNLTGPRTALL